MTEDETSGKLEYEIRNGIFKSLCNKARTPESPEIDHNASIWFVWLKGPKKNDLKTECFQNGEISTQDRGFYLFDTPRQFALRPDIVITRVDGSRIILDAKWKSLEDNPRINYGIFQADMYQMYAYAKKYRTSEIWLLYPLNHEMRGHDEISFQSNDGVRVCIYFVDVANIEENLRELLERLRN